MAKMVEVVMNGGEESGREKDRERGRAQWKCQHYNKWASSRSQCNPWRM